MDSNTPTYLDVVYKMYTHYKNNCMTKEEVNNALQFYNTSITF